MPRPVVFFDLDDTLFDHTWSMRASIEALRAGFDGVGRMSRVAVEAVYVEVLERLHLQVLAGTLTIPEARRLRLERILSDAGDSTDAASVARAVKLQRDSYQESRRVVPGSVALVNAVQRHARVGILTNNVRDEQVDKLEVCGLGHLVPDMVASGDLGISKPDPEIFHVAMRRMNTDVKQCVMVGDSWRSDIEGARGVGMRAVWFNRNQSLKAAGPEPRDVPQFRSWDPVDEAARQLVRLAAGD